MNKIIKVNNTKMLIKEYKGNRVVTFKDIDTVHNRPEGTARRNFNIHKSRFIEGVDYYIIERNSPMYEFRTLETIPPKGITIITESGYLMLVKSFMLNIFVGFFNFFQKRLDFCTYICYNKYIK